MAIRCSSLLLCFCFCWSGAFAAPIDDVDVSLSQLEQALRADASAAQAQIEQLKPRIASLSADQAGRLLIAMAVSKIFSADFQEAMSLLDKAEAKVQAPRYLSQIYNYRATCLIGLRRYQDALLVMGRNLALLDKMDDPVEKRDSYIRVANLYEGLEAYEEMGVYAGRILALAEDNQDVKARCYGLFQLSVSQFGRGMYQQAEEGLRNSLSYCEKENFQLIVAMSNNALGKTEMALTRYAEAEVYLAQALQMYQKFNFQVEIVSTSALLSQVYLALGKNADAGRQAELVLTQRDGADNLLAKRDASQVMSKLAALRGNYLQAYQYLQQYLALNQQIFDEGRVKALAYQAARFSANEREQELNLLNKERELLLTKEMLREKERSNMLIFVALLSVIICLLGAFAVIGWRQKQRYMQLARKDPLTGIYNRATAVGIGELAFLQSQNRDNDFCVMLFDLDNFRQINDDFGQATGDWALCKVVQLAQAELSRQHIFARVSGEEFMVVMPQTAMVQAYALAERLCHLLSLLNTTKSGHQFVLRASFGISCRHDEDLSMDPVLNRANQALSVAKTHGGGCVRCLPDNLPSMPLAADYE